MIGAGARLLLAYDPEPTHLTRAVRLKPERDVTVLPDAGVQALYARQRRRLDPVVPLSEQWILCSIIPYSIICNLAVRRTVLETEQPETEMNREDRHGAHDGSYSKTSHACFRMTKIDGLLLTVLLAGCQSIQDVYLEQATDHATAVELEQAMGHPTYQQTLDTGQRRWLYHQEGVGQAAEILRCSVKISD